MCPVCNDNSTGKMRYDDICNNCNSKVKTEMNLPTLYGKSTNGKIKEWNISVLKMGDDTCYIETEHGYEDGKKQLDQRYVGEGKNIGRANETSPYEQASSEAKSAHNRKKDSGYVADKTQIPSESDGMFLPMLAHRHDKHSAKIKFPCLVQPKLDGVRMLARKDDGVVTMWSRKGKLIDIPDKINSQLCEMLSDGQCTDGELYVHGWTFQKIIAAVKKKRDDTDLLEYHIYDSPHPTLTFEMRLPQKGIGTVMFPPHCQGWTLIGKNIKFISTYDAADQVEFDMYEGMMVQQGYEGMMVRNQNSLYKYKHRSYDLQKVKRFVDDEFEIIGGKDGSGRESGLVVFRCVTGGGLEFDVRPKGTHEVRAEIFKNLNKYIGKSLTVRYQELTDDGRPRFPVGIAVRDYE
jgi:DNA ligase-1